MQHRRPESPAPERDASTDHAPAELVEERQAAQPCPAVILHPVEDVGALDRMPDAPVLGHFFEEALRLLGGAHVGAERYATG